MSSNVKVLLVSLAVLAIANCAFGIGPIECNRPNEEYSCGGACQTTCQNYGQICPIVNIRCNDACYCREGFARDSGDNGTCIPISQCRKY